MPLLQRRQAREFLLRAISAGRYHTGALPDSSFGITRRALLLSAGAAAAAASYRYNDLEVLSNDDQIDVRLRGLTWTIARRSFGPFARLNYRKVDGAHRILVSRASWPGSERSIGVEAIIQNVLGDWHLNFKVQGMGFFSIPLMDWLDGQRPTAELTDRRFSLALGEQGELSVRGPARWMVAPDWIWTIEGNLFVADGSKTISLQCSELTIQVKESDAFQNRTYLLDEAKGPVTLISLRDARPAPIRISDVASGPALQVDFKATDRTEIILFESRVRSAVGFLTSGDAEVVAGANATGDPPIRVALEKAALVSDVGAKHRELYFAALVGRHNQAINLGEATAVVAGDANEPFLLDLSGEAPAGISLKLLLRELSVPVEGADMATLSFPDKPITLSFGQAPHLSQMIGGIEPAVVEHVALRKSPAAQRSPEPAVSNEILIWRNDGAGAERCADVNVDLEGSRLRLFRARDLLNISFGFHNLRLECGRDGGRIVPRLISTNEDPQSQRYLLLVYFPPQHIFEMAFRTGDPLPTREDGAVEARLSAPSRIVFDLMGRRKKPVLPSAKPEPIKLTVAELTKWKTFGLAVHDRAQESSVPLSRQLEIAGIVDGDTRGDAFAGIARSLTEPNALQTSIEPAYRMIVSPPADAIWSTPTERPDVRSGMNGDYLLWHASLDPDYGGKDLRVLWARGVDLSFLFGIGPQDGGWQTPWTEPSPPPPRDFVASLRASQRRELMMLSSVYGLPANKDPRYAVPAPPGLSWIVNDQQNQAFEGIFVPKPLQQANLTLTSIGGSFVAVGVWTPPAPISASGSAGLCCDAGASASALRPRLAGFPNPQPNWYPAVNLERLRYFSHLASDIYVEPSEKYFSFPYGQKATVLQITRREFWPDPLTNETTAYLKQRYFVVFDNPVKTYPAPNQADQARGIPVKTLTMLTQRTPEIVDPMSAIARLDDNCGNSVVFRPLLATAATGGPLQDVMFEYQINSDAACAVSPLIFVNNSAAHDANLMAALVLTYNAPADPPQKCMQTIPPQFRVVGHGGARRQYADSIKAGDTTFETLTWNLSAAGRDPATLGSCTDANCAYIMTTPMECADQPGFYPLLDTASVRVQSLDRLLGSSAGAIEIQMNRGFVKFGFDAAKNPSEIFLDVLNPAVHLDLSADGSKSGGVAKPNARVVALSRKIGLIGGRPTPADPSKQQIVARAERRLAQAAANDYAPDGAASAMAGQFDAAEFFGAALSDATLLGLVSLKDILKVVLIAAAPKLIETVGYALDGEFGVIQKALLAALKALAQAVTDFEAIANDKVKVGSLTWRDLYPDLAGSLATFADKPESYLPTMAVALRQASSFGDPALLKATNNLVSGGNAVLSAIDGIVKNPMPPLLGKEIEEIVVAWNQLRLLGFAGDIETAIINAVRDQILNSINAQITAFCGSLCQGATDELTLLLGISAAQCSQPLNPDTLLQAVGDALFDETFAAPLVQSTTQLNSAIASVDGAISTIQTAARAGSEQLSTAVFSLAASAANSCLAAAELADISASAQANCTQIFKAVQDLAVLPFADAKALQTAISSYEAILDGLDNEFFPPAAMQALQPLRNAARATLNDAASVLVRLGTARDLATKLSGQCNFAALKPIQDVFDLRRDATIRLKDLVQNTGRMIDALAGVVGGNSNTTQIGSTLSNLSKAGSDLLRQVTSISDLTSATKSPVWGELASLTLPTNSSYAANVNNAVQEAQGRATAISGYIDTSLQKLVPGSTVAEAQKSMSGLMTQAASIVAFSTDVDRRLAALLAEGTQLPAEVLTALNNLAAKALLPVVQFTILFYQPCVDALNAISNELTKLDQLLGQATDSTAGTVISMVPPEVVSAVQSAYQQSQQELLQLKSIVGNLQLDASGNAVPANVAQAVATTRALLDGWTKNQPAIVVAVKSLKGFAEMLLRGNFSALIDLNGFRQQIQDSMSQLVPTTVDLDYTFETDVDDFPDSGSPLFSVVKNDENSKALKLSASVHIDLLKGKRTVSTIGSLQPFVISLIPGFNALTLNMSAAEFGSNDTSGSSFKVAIQTIEVGDYLKFIQELTSYLGSGNATGPYYQIELAPPSIEVGYRYSKPVLFLGGISFLNVGFSISALLPIDNRAALFKLSLADQYDPFMIEVLPCYGGGGFIAFTGNPKGIVSIEASFEFGAVVAYAFGPLSAAGQVSAGIYVLRSAEGSGVIRGFVHAMGEGNLACFSICVNIEVWVQMELPSGHVTGGAHFEFSFKVAFAEISYGFDASYTFQGGASAALQGGASVAGSRLVHAAEPRTLTKVPRKFDQWLAYRKMFGSRSA